MIASMNGHHRIVQLLILKGAELHPLDSNLYHIHLASINGYHRVIEILLEQGVEINIKDAVCLLFIKINSFFWKYPIDPGSREW